MRGRPPSWNVIESATLWTESVPVASLDRIVLPREVRRRVGFLRSGTSAEALAVLQPFSAELLPYEEAGLDILTEVERVISKAEAGVRPGLQIAAMAKYTKLSIEPSGRLVLPSTLATHLHAHLTSTVRVVAQDGGLWLWRESEWRTQLADQLGMLPG
jgi:DNA-binding transcriptional regulator/RsmH inhibitor MraZ